MDQDRAQCALHEQRLNTMEETLKQLADSMGKIQRLADRSIGALSVLLMVQPVVTGVVVGLILYWVTGRHK